MLATSLLQSMRHYYRSFEIIEESENLYSVMLGEYKLFYRSLERAIEGIKGYYRYGFPIEVYECDGKIIDGERGGKWLSN